MRLSNTFDIFFKIVIYLHLFLELFKPLKTEKISTIIKNKKNSMLWSSRYMTSRGNLKKSVSIISLIIVVIMSEYWDIFDMSILATFLKTSSLQVLVNEKKIILFATLDFLYNRIFKLFHVRFYHVICYVFRKRIISVSSATLEYLRWTS